MDSKTSKFSIKLFADVKYGSHFYMNLKGSEKQVGENAVFI